MTIGCLLVLIVCINEHIWWSNKRMQSYIDRSIRRRESTLDCVLSIALSSRYLCFIRINNVSTYRSYAWTRQCRVSTSTTIRRRLSSIYASNNARSTRRRSEICWISSIDWNSRSWNNHGNWRFPVVDRNNHHSLRSHFCRQLIVPVRWCKLSYF